MYDCNQHHELPKLSINLKIKIMKNLNQDSSNNFFNEFKLSNEEMIYVRGGGESSDEPTVPVTIPPKL